MARAGIEQGRELSKQYQDAAGPLLAGGTLTETLMLHAIEKGDPISFVALAFMGAGAIILACHSHSKSASLIKHRQN